MKKNIQINLFGTLYNIDEDAYQLLDNYLESMKRYFSTQEIGNEVADDIEHRVAELLWEKKNSGMEAVNVDVVKEIIGKIGNPQEIDNENSESRNSETSEESNSDSNANAEEKKGWKENLNEMADDATEGAKKTYNNVKNNMAGKKLYRDPYDKVLGGVCSGLAHYFGGDPLLWRIILVIIFLVEGIGLLLYLILWLIVPLARTPEDRLRMNGQAVNPDTLNQQILQDQNTTPVPHENRGCLMGCFGLLMLPFLFLFLIIILSLLGGLFGGSMGLLGGLLGMSCLPFKYTFGSSNYELASDPAFWWGISLLVIAIGTGIWLLIHSRKHPEMKSSNKLLTIILIVLLLFQGCRGIVKAFQNYKNNIEINFDTDIDDDDDDDDDWDDEDSTLNGGIVDTTIVDTAFDDNIEFDEDAQVNISNKGVSVTKGGKKINITPNGIKIKKTVTVPKKRVITN